MSQLKHAITLILLIGLSCCKTVNKETDKTTESTSPDLQVDHFNIWVTDYQKAKEKLIEIGFIALPDSLSQVHHGQGTTGRYFYFLNSYLELIFINDEDEFKENNNINKELDFIKRADFKNNGASPFSIALKVKDYAIEKIPFKKVQYHQNWMEDNSSIYAAKNSKLNLQEPSLFVVYPEIESDQFESIADLTNIPEEYAFIRNFFRHPNGAQKVSKIIISSVNLDLNSETMKAINKVENVVVKKGDEHLMELYFDNHIQGKSYDLRPELPLIIYL